MTEPTPTSRIQRHIANHDLEQLTAGQLKELLRILRLPQGRRQKGGAWIYLTNDERRREIRRKVGDASFAHDWNLERFADALDEMLETTEASGNTPHGAQLTRKVVGSMADSIMTPQHPQAKEFVGRLGGPEGCNFQEVDGKSRWDCAAGRDKSKATAILEDMGGIDVAASLAYFEAHGGYCDCEILFNVFHEFETETVDLAGFLADERMSLLNQVEGLAAFAKLGATPNNASEAVRAEILERLRQANDLVTELLAYYSEA